MRKGFTLIELLAVIVILAIIALITIPAVLKMVDNAKLSSYRRSIDLYGKALNTAIAAYKSDKIEKKEPYQLTFENVSSYVDYEGNDINCKISKIYSDDTILLTECNVEGNQVLAEKNKGYGTNNYYYYTNATKRMRILEYIDGVNKALEGKENIGNTCQVQEDGNLVCNGQTIEVISNLDKPISGTIMINNNKVIGYSQLKFADKKVETGEEIPQVVDEQEINTGNNQNNNSNQENSSIPSYIGYYADVDSDGTVDGVIYADLAHSKSEIWGSDGYGIYSYTYQTNLKEYIISENKYSGRFGEKEIITLKPNSSGDKRFYVMALNDFTTGSISGEQYYWYNNAYGKMNASDTSVNFGTGYTNTGTIIDIWNAGENGKYNAAQDDNDIFKYIQEEYAKGWYIPSRGEWAAFADYLSNRKENTLTSDKYDNNISEWDTSGNYDDIYGLKAWYWSSSQNGAQNMWFVHFQGSNIINIFVGPNVSSYVRLGITF